MPYAFIRSHVLFISLWFFLSGCASQRNKSVGIPAYVPASQELHDSIVSIDSILFDAYNTCKPDVFASLISEDIEFYHDLGGFTTSKLSLVEAIKDNICDKVTRELLPGSIEVYAIPGYGAIEMGAHRFHNRVENSTSAYSKFVHTWHLEDGTWRLARVISLH